MVPDLTVLEGVYEGTDQHIFAFAPTEQSGIQFAHNSDNIGLRLTELAASRSTTSPFPRVTPLGGTQGKEPIKAILNILWAGLLPTIQPLPTIQFVFSRFYTHIVLRALDFAAKYTVTNTRTWPYGGDNKEKPTDEFYILEHYGTFEAHLPAAEALADKAGLVITGIYNEISGKGDIIARERGWAAEWVASVKIVATHTTLRVTAGLSEVMGARATSTKVGLNRYWRDIRTHSLHDPVPLKNRELGRYRLLGEVPEVTWYP